MMSSGCCACGSIRAVAAITTVLRLSCGVQPQVVRVAGQREGDLIAFIPGGQKAENGAGRGRLTALSGRPTVRETLPVRGSPKRLRGTRSRALPASWERSDYVSGGPHGQTPPPHTGRAERAAKYSRAEPNVSSAPGWRDHA